MPNNYDPLWGIPLDFTGTKEYPEAEVEHTNKTLTAQAQGAISLIGAGIASGWVVTPGTGLDVNITAGLGAVISPTYGPVALQTSATVNRPGFAANATSYLFAAIDVTANVNDSRETRAPAFVIAGTNTLAGGILLATVVAGTTTVTVTLPAPKPVNATTLNNQAPAYYLSRNNHTDTQLASTVSNFDTQVRTNRLDQMAAPTSAVSANSQKVTNLAAPTAANDATTKTYVDTAIVAGKITNYSNANGQDFKLYQTSELLTIAAAASTATAGSIPAGAVVRSVSLRVVTAIPTATTFDIGVTGATARYGAALSVAAGTTAQSGGTNSPSCYSANTTLLITPNATPASATGQVRVTWYYDLATAPTS